MKIMKSFKYYVVCCMLCLLFMISLKGIKVKAADSYLCNMASDVKQKVSNTVFVAKQYQDGDDYKYKLIMTKNNKKKIISKNTTCSFVTNGRILYYVEIDRTNSPESSQNTIYKYEIKSGEKTKIVSGENYCVAGCSGTYLYCGPDNGADGIDLYSLNLKTKKKKHMIDIVGNVYVCQKRVVTGMCVGDAGDYPIHSFKLDGTGKKKIVEGCLIKTEKNKIYYYHYGEKNGTWKYKVCQCSPTEKNKKALTGWVSQLPEKYTK